jgi:SEC-C motif-containing protein
MNCPCCSGKNYEECCKEIIANENAPTAIRLMRSRYTAYTQGNVEYLYNTTHSSTIETFQYSDIEEWLKENEWTNLEIISQEHGNINDNNGIVEFKAYSSAKSGDTELLHERSKFVKENGKWFYVDGIINPPKVNIMQKVQRNDPCPCGSGKKHKKCCGKNL